MVSYSGALSIGQSSSPADALSRLGLAGGAERQISTRNVKRGKGR